MNIKKKCEQINSLLGDISSSSIKGVPDMVYEMRTILSRIVLASEAENKYYQVYGKDTADFVCTGATLNHLAKIKALSSGTEYFEITEEEFDGFYNKK
jgi:hypothetical protein